MTRTRAGRVAVGFVVVAALAVVLTTVFTDRGGADDRQAAAAAAARSRVAGPERYSGLQGTVGQFVVQCLYSHTAPDDPIVHFGHSGMSHSHDFYGATGTNARSTAAQLHREPTTCDKTVDTAGYWQPTLFDHDVPVRPRSIQAYYRAAPGVDPDVVRAFPFGLKMLAGDQYATSPQPGDAAGWTCGARPDLLDTAPECPGTAPLHLVLTFPDCWDGEHVDTTDHVSHMAYSAHGRCPGTHPVHVPQLTVAITFPVSGSGHDLRLASGPLVSAHGDFFNAWDPTGLEREIAQCIRRRAVCDLASSRQESPLFQTR